MFRFLFVCLGLFTLTNVAFAFDIPSSPTGYVNDYANVLTVETKEGLEKQLMVFNASTTNEIAVVTVPDLGGVTIEEYAVKLFEKWKIGKAKEDNGVLLLVSVGDRVARIEVGYGLEGALPDILAKDILNTKILPEFKKGSYSLGVLQGVQAIMEATQGEYKAGKFSSLDGINFEAVIVFTVIIFQFFVAIFARSKSWWAGGIFGGVIGAILAFLGVFGASLLVGSLVTIILVLLGLLFDYIISSDYSNVVSGGGSIPWWGGGGGGGGGSSSGGSFGGFGGGSSGGGGASGRW
jgi:uncharacterized protein